MSVCVRKAGRDRFIPCLASVKDFNGGAFVPARGWRSGHSPVPFRHKATTERTFFFENVLESQLYYRSPVIE